MKKIVAINGSPRKNGNTSTLINKALEGAASKGAAIKLIHLYDLDYKGCVSCFSCKSHDESKHGKCAVNDGLSPFLKEMMEADALIIGSPIYLGDVTGQMRAFFERLIYMNLSHNDLGKSAVSNCKKIISTAVIYTMGIETSSVYEYLFKSNANFLSLLNGPTEYMISADTYQFSDYSKYAVANIDVAHKEKVRATQLPIDLEKAFSLGLKLAL